LPIVEFTLNGSKVSASCEEGTHLLELLRETFGIHSAKDGCAPEGYCGCCTVLLDGNPVPACSKKPEQFAGREVVTLDGIPDAERRVLAEAFVREGAIQCGFCTPGIMVRAVSLVRSGRAGKKEAVETALSPHLCRCTGYSRIVNAIRSAGAAGEGPGASAAAASSQALGSSARAPGGSGVGESARHYEGIELALGQKPFLGDLAVPGMLHGAVVLSRHPRARVLAIDPSAALLAAGVVRVMTAADVPGERFVGLIVRDWPIFVAEGETTRCVGDVLALVVADTQARARAAAGLVAVAYDVLAPVTDPMEALSPEAPAIHPRGNLLEVCAFARGNADEALAASAHVLHEVFRTQRIEHAFLEPEACLAMPAGDGLKVFSQGQGVHDDQLQIAAILGIPREAVEVELVSTGGAFGGKEDLSIQGQTALAARLLGAPVRTVLTRAQSILLHPKRHPLTLDYTVGCDADGRLTAVRARIVGDTGAYASVGMKVLERAAGHSCGPYRVPNVDVEAKTVYTNNPPSGAMRGFGANQASFAIEGMLDRLAAKVGLDGWDIRDRNVLGPGDRFATGQKMDQSCGVRATLEAVREAYKGAKVAGIACGIKNTGIGNGMQDIGRVKLLVLPGGKLEIRTGYTEMGQGLFTILRQVVHSETGIAPEAMTVRTTSDLSVLCGMTTASRATALASTAAQFAGRELSAAMTGGGGGTLRALEGREFAGEFICDFTTKPGDKTDDPVTHMTFGYATQVVILDDAGKLKKVVAAHDVGRAMNPAHCAGQIEGAVHMGLGYALSEDLPLQGGVPVSTRLRDLGILRASEVPEIEVILVEVADRVGAYGAKGVGEIGLVPTAGAVAGALFAFDGKRRNSLPMSDSAAAAASVPKIRGQAP
jgi:xanthine dehydrogenase molybdenum-binding subunit